VGTPARDQGLNEGILGSFAVFDETKR
jgi:hypothetical protein